MRFKIIRIDLHAGLYFPHRFACGFRFVRIDLHAGLDFRIDLHAILVFFRKMTDETSLVLTTSTVMVKSPELDYA